MRFSLRRSNLLLTPLLALLVSLPLQAQDKDFKVCWSVFAGWMPWGYAAEQGIMKKWADKYGIRVTLQEVPDYVESIERYSAGEFAACSMTNMDALTLPAAADVDSTVLIIGDFSDGADGLLLRGGERKLADLKGKTVLLVENSVSHYLLSRALDWALLEESDVTLRNVSDRDIVETFLAGEGDAVITWNPLLSQIRQKAEVTQVFSSRHIPGEILDLTVINSRTLAEHPELGKALTGAWFETQRLMGLRNPTGQAARARMASAAGTTSEDFDAQLKTLRSFYAPRYALRFASAAKLPEQMRKVVGFADAQQLLGTREEGREHLGIRFDDGSVLGDPERVRLRFDNGYMRLAAEGAL